MLRILHVGCGTDPLPDWLCASPVAETRLDIDRRADPDIVAPMINLGDIGPFDVVYSSHVLEHAPPSHVHQALTEQLRVLVPKGRMICVVPDLEDVKPTTAPLMDTPAGPVCGLDLIYGYHGVTGDNPFMRHLSGFIRETLTNCIEAAGFKRVEVRRLPNYQLIAIGTKP